MKYPIRSTELHANYDARIKLHADLDAKVFDAFVIELLGAEVTVYDHAGKGLTLHQLWDETLHAARQLRAQPFVMPYPPDVFVPFVNITVTESKRVADRISLFTAMLCGGAFSTPAQLCRESQLHAGEERVRHLGRAVDLLAALEGWTQRVPVLQ